MSFAEFQPFCLSTKLMDHASVTYIYYDYVALQLYQNSMVCEIQLKTAATSSFVTWEEYFWS